MAAIKRIIQPSQFKVDLLNQFIAGKIAPKFVHYDVELDELFMVFQDKEIPNAAHPLDDFISLLFEPISMEVIGVQVDDFQGEFLSRCPTVRKVWKVNDCCDNFEDIQRVYEKKEPQIAREVACVAEQLLKSGNYRCNPVPA